MKRFVVLYACAALVMFPLDVAWISLMTRNFYKPRLGEFLLPAPSLAPAAAFYLFYVVGIVVFAMLPAVAAGSWRTALGLGALLGFIAYGTYDLTNLASARGFSGVVAVVDIAWGTFATAAAATVGFLIAHALADLS